MTAQVLSFNVFSKNAPHFNVVVVKNPIFLGDSKLSLSKTNFEQ